MLTDRDLDSLANVHAGSLSHPTGPRLVAVRRFALGSPSGFYYSLKVESKGEESHRLEDTLLVGSGGFFADRNTGVITDFGSGEVFYTSAALASKAGVRFNG